jgi:hypothetical protein
MGVYVEVELKMMIGFNIEFLLCLWEDLSLGDDDGWEAC